ncbi:hypothetical protein SPRG_01891 [Saprolegnia parasitica CBS 223.65]|uniref:Uncharacterized protein n=1 Tax=Saprolegnia parasitica (strain CBS 223.65) TaxID=695850 RepID=A0A067D2V1_SAPPC|nr:hypothetical protein SPRG_01891 [Saprolegnia parasitica CBS 223.65]KDO33076.1 hypothetical protein SPRG_01891 [Saprolegnia parasitica CBS 223.65]|eukprot:XP_012195847.1 hypothetical protein SPRG_01891 [Saprolegnia parasitica CBS 223.65]
MRLLSLVLGCAATACAATNDTWPLVCQTRGDDLCDTATDVCPPCVSSANISSPVCVGFNTSGVCPDGFYVWSVPNVTLVPVPAPTSDTITLPPTTTPAGTTEAPSTMKPTTTSAPTTTAPTTAAPTTQPDSDANTRAEMERRKDERADVTTMGIIVVAVAGTVAAVASVLFVKRSKHRQETTNVQTPRRDVLITHRAAPAVDGESHEKRYSDWLEINAVVSPQAEVDLVNGTPLELWDELPILQRNRERELTLLENHESTDSVL